MPKIQTTSLAEISQIIFEKYYLKPFDGHEKYDLYSLPIERPIHGAMHASRVALLIPVIVNIYKKSNYPGADTLTKQDIHLLQIVGLFHDAIRGSDRGGNKTNAEWEKASAKKCKKYLMQFDDVDEETASCFSQLITQKENGGLLGRILQSADSIDIMRCRFNFYLEKTALYKDHQNNQSIVENEIIPLVVSMRELIENQYDLSGGCSVILEEKILIDRPKKESRKYDQKSKAAYELSKTCFSQIEKEFDTELLILSKNKSNEINESQTDILLNYSRLSEKMKFILEDENVNFCCFEKESDAEAFLNIIKFLTKEKHSIEMSTCQIRKASKDNEIFFQFKISSEQIEAVGESLWSLRFPNQDRIAFKSLRFDSAYFFPDFLKDTIKTKNPSLKQAIRPAPKLTYTVRPNLKDPKKPALVKRSEKESMYSEKEKDGFSHIQSCSIATITAQTPAFGHPEDPELVCIFLPRENILTNRLFKKPELTVKRPYDFHYSKEANDYYKEKINSSLFDTESEFIKNLDKNQVNEVLARMRVDSSAQFAIAKDSLCSRLIAKHYANLAKEKLKLKHDALNLPWDDHFEFSVFYYLPGDMKHFSNYTDAQYAIDLDAARRQIRDPKGLEECIQNVLYPLLLAESDKNILKQHLNTMVTITISKQNHSIPFWLKLLNNGYVQILDYAEQQCGVQIDFSWIEKENFDLSVLNGLAFHALRWNESKHFETLKQYGMSLHAFNKKKETILYSAAMRNQIHFVKKLVESGVNINQTTRDIKEATALHVAAQNGYLDIVQYLVENRADVNLGMKNDNTTPLYVAAQNGYLDIVQYLIENKAKINGTTKKDGASALLAATQKGHFNIVKFLIEMGADINQTRASDGFSALDIAQKLSHHDIIHYIRQHNNLLKIENSWAPSFFTPSLMFLEFDDDPQYVFNGKTFLSQFIQNKHIKASLDLLSRKPKLIFTEENYEKIRDNLKQNYTPTQVAQIINQANIKYELKNPRCLAPLFHYAQKQNQVPISKAALDAIHQADQRSTNQQSSQHKLKK